jgi:hypothetical protein
MTQRGLGTITPHAAIVNQRGFGETIRGINGSPECDGGNPGRSRTACTTTPGSPVSWASRGPEPVLPTESRGWPGVPRHPGPISA